MTFIAGKPTLCVLRVRRAPGNNLTISQRLAVGIGVRIGPRTPSVPRRLGIPSEVVDVGAGRPRGVFELDLRAKGTGTSDLQVVGQTLEDACSAVRGNGAGRRCLDVVVLPVGENNVLEIVVALALKFDATLVEVGIHGVLECVAVIVAGKIVVGADFTAANGLGGQTEFHPVRATVCSPLAEAELDLGLVRGADVGEEVDAEEVIPVHDAGRSTRVSSPVIDEVSKFAAQGAVLAAGHATQAIGVGPCTEWLGLLVKCWRPLVALVICCRWVAELLAEGEVGADTAAERIVEVAA